jgi:hypothetical protein
LPEASVVVVAVAVPVRLMVTPLATAPETVPEIVYVGIAVEVKLAPGTLALLTVGDRLVGLKVNPALLGVTV